MLVLKGLFSLHRTIHFNFFSITGRGIDLDYHDIEWFALESNLPCNAEDMGLVLGLGTKIMASRPITSWQIDGETVETVADFYFLRLQNHCRW